MEVKFEMPTDEQAISPICEFTYSWCLNSGLTPEASTRFTIAVSELISDVILFAYPHNSSATFEVIFSNSISDVELIVSEVGEPFDPDRHQYNSEKAITTGDFEGAGLRLIRRFCDEFLFINKGKEGKEFRLSKKIEPHDIDKLLKLSRSQRPAEPDPSSRDLEVQYEIHKIVPGDAEDIAKLIYRTYEYTYSKEDMYFPKKIEEAVLGKEKLGVITRTKAGEAIGYFAVLKKEDANIAEVGEAVVSPRYRRRGIMSNMMKRLIEYARDQELDAIFGKAVTIHPVSQRVNNKFGFKTTALMLAETDKVVYKGFDEQYPQQVSVVIDFLPLNVPNQTTVYLPQQYADIILETYEHLDIPISPQEPTANEIKMAEQSDIQLKINYTDSTSLITVSKFGPDFTTVLTDMLESLEQQETPNAIYLDLPMQNPATPSQFNRIKNLGFIYCGLAPQFHHESDFLRLQKIFVPLDLNLIEMYSDFGRKLKTYISDEYH